MQTRILSLLIAGCALICVLLSVDSRSKEVGTKADSKRWIGEEIDEWEAFKDARHVFESSVWLWKEIDIKMLRPPPWRFALGIEVRENFKRTRMEGKNTVRVVASRGPHNLATPEINDRLIVFTGKGESALGANTVFKLLPSTKETLAVMRSLAEEMGPVEVSQQWIGEEINASKAFNNADAVFEGAMINCVKDPNRMPPPWRYMLAVEARENFKNFREGTQWMGFVVQGDPELVVIPEANDAVIIFTGTGISSNTVHKMMKATDETRALMRKLRDSNKGAQ